MGRVLSFVACVLIASAASATVLVPAEFTEIVRGSQIIAYARIVQIRPEWADGRRWIDTVVTADVLSNLKGSADQTLTFKVPGGQLGRYRSVVVGAPVFAAGDEAVLFLKARGDDLPRRLRPEPGRVQGPDRFAIGPARGGAASGHEGRHVRGAGTRGPRIDRPPSDGVRGVRRARARGDVGQTDRE